MLDSQLEALTFPSTWFGDATVAKNITQGSFHLEEKTFDAQYFFSCAVRLRKALIENQCWRGTGRKWGSAGP